MLLRVTSVIVISQTAAVSTILVKVTGLLQVKMKVLDMKMRQCRNQNISLEEPKDCRRWNM